MIKVNDTIINVSHFPDNTQFFKLDPKRDLTSQIYWQYEDDSELFIIYCIVRKIRELFLSENISLIMPYIPNARMDRIKHVDEIHTLKYFSELINSMGFTKVCVFDPHSEVSTALINCIQIEPVENTIKKVLNLCPADCKIFFPDKGSMKRYSDFDCFKNRDIFYGEKIRNWETGEITSLEIYDRSGKTIEFGNWDVLMIDDIISYGGTMYYSALKLKNLTKGNIYAYSSHTENSILNPEKGKFVKLLDEEVVKELYTTNSIYSGHHPNILIVKNFYDGD